MFKTNKYLSRFFLIFPSLLLTTCFYSMSGCSSGKVKKVIVPGLDADYLVLNDKILLNFFGSPDEKDWALKTLEVRCEDNLDPHACYNLATHLYSLKNFSGAVKFAELAVKQSPEDPLYLEMYRHSVLENGKFDDESKSILPVSSISFKLTKLESLCRQNKSEEAFPIASELISQSVLSLESTKNGFLSECLSEKMISNLKNKPSRNKINYTSYYYNEKNKSNSFSSVWDTSYYTKNMPLEKEDIINSRLTQYWKDFRKAVSAKNEKLARNSLSKFTKELNQEKAHSRQNTHLFLAIERAAKLLIEQDAFFARYKNLADEL